MIDDVVEGRCKIMISAQRVRSISCVGFCPFIFEGLVSLDNVEIKLEDFDEISTIMLLCEFGQCRRVVTDMLLVVSSAKVLSLDFNILKKGVEEVKRLKDIADLKSKTMHLDLEDLKQLEQILNEGLLSVMENKEQLLKAQLDRSKKKEQILMGQLELSNKRFRWPER